MSTTPVPQPTGPTEDDAADALAQTSLGPQIAQNVIQAGIQNNGSPRDWAENTVASVTAALAGFGAAGKVPPGAGALYGVGAAARQGQARQDELNKEKAAQHNEQIAQQQRQETINLEKQRQSTEESQWGKDYQIRLAENARQQANQIKEFAVDDANLQRLTDEHNEANQKALYDHAAFMEKQLEYTATAHRNGWKLMEGAPTFNDLGQAEKWAEQADLASNMHVAGYVHRPLLNPDMTINIGLQPDDGVKEVTLPKMDLSKGTFTTHLDDLGVANYMDNYSKLKKASAETREANARADELEAEASKFRNLSKGDDTLKGARQAFDKTVDLAHPNGDFNSLPPGQKEILAENARKQYQVTYAATQRAKDEFKKMVSQAGVDGGLPIDEKTGEVDTNSNEYKDAKSQLDRLTEALNEAQDDMNSFTTLGHQVKVTEPPAVGGEPTEKNLPISPPKPGAPIPDDILRLYLREAGGDVQKAKAAATSAGWGPPSNPQ